MHLELIAALRDFIRIFEERAHTWLDYGGKVDQVFHISNENEVMLSKESLERYRRMTVGKI